MRHGDEQENRERKNPQRVRPGAYSSTAVICLVISGSYRSLGAVSPLILQTVRRQPKRLVDGERCCCDQRSKGEDRVNQW